MRRSKALIALFAGLIVFGGAHLLHFFENVRGVVVLGIFANGMICGAALVGLILALMGRIPPPEKQPPPREKSREGHAAD